VLKKWLGVFVVLALLMGGAKAADGFALYASSKSFLFYGVGAAYKTGSLRFNLGASTLYFLPGGLQAGAALLVPLSDQQSGGSLYAGGGIEADLYFIFGVSLVSLYPYGALGLAWGDGSSLELRLGYAFLTAASEGQSAGVPLGFTLGVAYTTPLPSFLPSPPIR
jgi:hypothetical protein